MIELKHVGVFLNGTQSDETTIRYAALLVRVLGPQRVAFVRYRDTSEEAGGLPTEAEFREQVRQHWGGEVPEGAVFRVVDAGGPAEIGLAASEMDTDVMVVGRWLPSGLMSVGSQFMRLARKAPCSVLLVPEGVVPHLSRILVAVDFSEDSRLALETALWLARRTPEPAAQVLCQHVYDVPYGYHYAASSLEEYIATLEQKRREQFARFVEGVDTGGIVPELILTGSHEPYRAVLDLAAVRKMDLIVVGRRGQTRMASMLLGGFAERLVAAATTPVLLVKRKGETIGLLKALVNPD